MVKLEETTDEHFRRANATTSDAEEWEDEDDGSDVVRYEDHDLQLTCSCA